MASLRRADLEGLDIDPADLEAILLASQQEGDALDARIREEDAKRKAQADDETAKAIEISMREEEKLRQEKEDSQLQEALALSSDSKPPEPKLIDDEDAIQRALRESEEEARAAEVRRLEALRTEDEGELFQAALRASCVDLGPRGISQAAKIMATGDTGLGHAALVKKTGSHTGAGSTFTRVPSGTALPPADSSSAGTSGPADRSRPSSKEKSRESSSSSLRGAGLSLAAGASPPKAGGPAPKSLSRAAPSRATSSVVAASEPFRSSQVANKNSKTNSVPGKARPAPPPR